MTSNKSAHNVIIHGDCLEIMKQMPDKSVDLVVADPPYGISAKGRFDIPEKHYYRVNQEWDMTQPTPEWMKEVERILKDGSCVYITGTSHNIFDVRNYLESETELKFQNFITWFKPNAMPIKFAKNRGVWAYSCEYILYYSKGKVKTFNYDDLKQSNGGKQHRDLITLKTCQDDKTGHPTQKPLRLFRKLVMASSKEGDLVVDPFCGSGTTGVVCRELKRQFIGIELNPEYVEMAKQRLASIPNSLEAFA